MTSRYAITPCFAACLAVLVPVVALAAWSTDPVAVQPTTDRCPLVAAGSDGSDGAIVVWRQRDAADPSQHLLLARRILASGDLDPAWPAGGLLVSSESQVEPTALGVVGDGIGGAYVWWMEGDALLVSRVRTGGSIAPGWDSRGRGLGTLNSARSRPQVLPDGHGGLWLGWLSGTLLTSAGYLMHIGPDGHGVGGWGDEAATYAVSRTYPTGRQTLACGFGPTSDGGAWIVWGDATAGSSGWQAGSCRLSRLDATGDLAAGWTANGRVLAPFHAEFLGGNPYYATSLVAVASDGAEGAYVLAPDLADSWITTHLLRFDAAGDPAAGWPAGGIETGIALALDAGADASARLFALAGGDVLETSPISGTHQAGALVSASRVTPAAVRSPWGGGEGRSVDIVVQPTGAALVATCWPDGPLGPYSPPAFLRLDQTLASGAKGPGLWEAHPEPAWSWYDDVGVAPTSDEGAIFVWSQHNQRYGVFARRFGATGEVTAVPSGREPGATLRLRFADGRGVVATLGGSTGGRIELLDVAGRSLAGTDVPSGAGEIALAGSKALAPGLYFARHRAADGRIETGKVAIVR